MTDKVKGETPIRHICVVCKQTNLIKYHNCSECKQKCHRRCLKKFHEMKNDNGEVVTCLGPSKIAASDEMDTFSIASSESRNMKRKRDFDDDEYVIGKVEIIMEKIEDICIIQENLKMDINNIIIHELSKYQDQLLKKIDKTVEVAVSKQLEKIFNDLNIGKIEQVKENSYADKVKNSSAETVVVEPKKKQDSEETFIEVKSKVKVGKLGVNVQNVKKAQAGKIVINCAGRNDRELLASELKKNLGDNYKIKETKKKHRKLRSLAWIKTQLKIQIKILLIR